MNAVALVLVAGREASLSIRGESLLSHAVRGLLQSENVRHVIVMVSPRLEVSRGELAPFGDAVRILTMDPGDAVGRSLAEAVRAVPGTDVVLLHDPARAFTPVSLVDRVVGAVEQGAAAVVPVLPVTDTIKRMDSAGNVCATVDRSQLRAVQGPQAYAVDIFCAACERGDDVAEWLDRLDKPVATVPGHPHAREIRTEFDLAVARAIMVAERATDADR